MVRLKVPESITKLHQGAKFQFHMVRLKEDTKFKPGHPGYVSIPHGSIKRTTRASGANRFTKVSIPHGSIKSNECIWQGERDAEFQFHMVRLKV